MNYGVSLAVLFLAAVLEAGGDALMRNSLHSSDTARRIFFLVASSLVLTSYGYAVNVPPWNFGKLLGVYVAFFFVVAQLIDWIVFDQKPTATIFVGGALIAIGGLVVSLGK